MAQWLPALLLKAVLLQAASGEPVDLASAQDSHCPSQAPESEAVQERALLQMQSAWSGKQDAVKAATPGKPGRHPHTIGLQVRAGARPGAAAGPNASAGTNASEETKGRVFVAEDETEEDAESQGHVQGPGFYADLSEEGYQATAETCCNYQMEEFVRRVVDDLGLELCGEGGLMGIVPFFTCEKGVQDYTTLRKQLLDSATTDCPIAALPESCPSDTSSCPGKPDPTYHRRRNCNNAKATTVTTTTTTGPTTTTVTKTTRTTTTETTTTVTTTTRVKKTTSTTSTTTTTTDTTTALVTTTTTSTGCFGETDVLDIFNSKMVHSNLGGAGPDAGATNMLFEGAGTFDGLPFDIVVQAISGSNGTYTAQKAMDNGFECGQPSQGCSTGHFGQINVAAGTTVDLTIGFQDSASQVPITLSSFIFSLHDIDQFESSVAEVVYISGFTDDVILDTASEVQVSEAADGRTKLTSSQEGTACDDPENPLRLTNKKCEGVTIDQKKRSAAFHFEATSSIALTLEVTCNDCAPGSGRSFLFAGDTNLVSCAGKA